MGPLTDDHQCPRRRWLRTWQLLGCTVGGGALGFIAMALFDPAQRSTDLDVWVIMLGAVMGAVTYRFLIPAR